MALDTRDKLIAAVSGGLRIPIYKSSMTNMAAGYICSLWRATGHPLWNQGAIPGAAATPTDNTTGGIALPWSSGYDHILRFGPIGVTAGTWMLYDRLAHMGGLVGNSTSSQTVNVALTDAAADARCMTNGDDVEWYVEIYTDLGTTASNLTVTYTDRNGTGSKTVTISGFTGTSPLNRAGRCVKIVPTDGLGIQSVQSVQLSASSGTAGSFGVTARKFLCSVSQTAANVMGVGIDAISIGLPEVKHTSCLEMLVQCSTTSTGIVQGDVLIGNAA